MGDLKIPDLVLQCGKISPAWTLTDLEMLHRMSRCGSSLAAIANSLPCLWYYQSKIRASILERCIEGDSRISRCTHPNMGTGDHSQLEKGETDLVLSAEEFHDFSDRYANLRNELLKLPQVDYEICLSRLEQLMKSLRKWNEVQQVKASKRLAFRKRRLEAQCEAQPRKRRVLQKTT